MWTNKGKCASCKKERGQTRQKTEQPNDSLCLMQFQPPQYDNNPKSTQNNIVDGWSGVEKSKKKEFSTFGFLIPLLVAGNTNCTNSNLVPAAGSQHLGWELQVAELGKHTLWWPSWSKNHLSCFHSCLPLPTQTTKEHRTQHGPWQQTNSEGEENTCKPSPMKSNWAVRT